jgi:hypothetical protein
LGRGAAIQNGGRRTGAAYSLDERTEIVFAGHGRYCPSSNCVARRDAFANRCIPFSNLPSLANAEYHIRGRQSGGSRR